MKLRRMVALSAAGMLAAAAAAGPALAQPVSSPLAPSAQALAASSAARLVASRPAELHASANDSFVQHQVITAPGGLQYVPYHRTHKGLPVIGGDFVVVTNNAGRVVSTSVAQEQTINLESLTPTVNQAKAESIARDQLSTVDSVSDTQLMVFALGTPRLGWQSTIVGQNAEGASRLTVVIDALTGTVLDSQEHVLRGEGTSAYNGANPVHLDTVQSAGTFSMHDPTLTNVSCQNAAGNVVFSGPDDLWGNGNGTDRETGCVDAFFAAQTEKRMLSQWLGRNGFNGSGGGWPIRVGLNDLNAFYDGAQIQIGHNQAGAWIGSLDVVAHEHGHGIDSTTPGGLSRSGTQEFVGDVFGASTEWFANEAAQFDPSDFLIGEEVNLLGQGPIRNMFNPGALGHPNCYSSSVPGMEVHAAAGPGNHWFYLTALGSNPTNGQPTSSTCNGTTVTGIGVQTALTIFYNAMLMKTTASSYQSYRTWTLQAAKNLTPGNCTNFNVVKAAWNAVSVPAQAADPICAPLAVVPNVMWWDLAMAIDAVQAAGFNTQTVPGIVDCGSPTVRGQNPAGGTSAPLGSTVFLEYNQQPGPGQDCP